MEIEALCGGRYAGFTARHFHDYLVRDNGLAWGYTRTKLLLQSRGLLRAARRRNSTTMASSAEVRTVLCGAVGPIGASFVFVLISHLLTVVRLRP